MDFTVRRGQLLVEVLDLGLEGGDVGVVLAFLGAKLVAQCRIDGGTGMRSLIRGAGSLGGIQGRLVSAAGLNLQ